MHPLSYPSTRLAGNYLHQVSDGAEEVRTLRDLAGDLVDCSVTRSQMEVKSFMHVCRLGLKDHRHKLIDSHKSLLNVAEAKSHCQAFLRRGTGSLSAGPGEQDKSDVGVETGRAHRRIKRGFTYPGTLWCGAGNIADNYDQLGEFAATDSCCRVHDHCPYVVQAFSTNFGYTNFKWHSISHCECDNALKECLRKVNDTSSRVVGQAFFNVIEVPCFEFALEDQCVERHWYGLCKRYDKVPIAVLRKSIPYDFGGIDVIDTLTLAPWVRKVPDTPESATQPLTSSSRAAGKEPSIGNVATVAEDFIKVLATVSTSHSSTTEAVRKEAHRGDRKKKKKMDRKMKKKKDKGQRRKQRVSALSRPEEATAVMPSGRRTEETVNDGLLNKDHTLERNVNVLTESMPHVGVLSHKLIKDEPQWRPADRSVSPAAPPTAARAEPPESGHQSGSAEVSSVFLYKGEKPEGRRGRGKKAKRTPTSAPRSSLGAEAETDAGGRTPPCSSPPAEQPVPESHTHTSQPQKTPRHKPRHNVGPKKKREDMTFSLSVERPVFSIPLTAALRTAPDRKAKGRAVSTALHTVSTETRGRLEPRNSEVHGERAALRTSTGPISTRPLRTEKQKRKASREQKPKRRIVPMYPSVPPVMGKLQATPQPQLQQSWLTWVHRMLGSLGNAA
ncbi:nucleolar protein dao-5 isoform X2 [Brienomyrus brachyistius]|uniref:nucleolar protein dao-5 isoform X2 n=1 Tax=Brienomyrus brachyistius TaxID=42636 RepID=UPI0020B33C1D|nr:nucleolar protein dao-5 isoform X2 [Brienomyrus brachyistius]